MIFYDHSWQLQGSVFPAAAKVAMPSALVTLVLSTISYLELFDQKAMFWSDPDSHFLDSSAWTGFSTLVGFLVVFRTSQAYQRFWDGVTATYIMHTEWFDACSSVMAFCKHSTEAEEKITSFQNLLVRLFSMLHALALAEIEDSGDDETAAFNYELIDIEAIDIESLRTLKSSECKVELVFQWIQQLLVESVADGVLSVPPPLLSRAFQELANGMVQFHDALKISCIPFPFPYAQTCDVLLWFHSVGTPLVMCQWVTKPWWAFVLSFTQVFILWCLNSIAIEIQNPFGSDANDIDAAAMQNSMNTQLLLLLQSSTKRTPRLRSNRNNVQLQLPQDCGHAATSPSMALNSISKKSFSAVFMNMQTNQPLVEELESSDGHKAATNRSTAFVPKRSLVEDDDDEGSNPDANRSGQSPSDNEDNDQNLVSEEIGDGGPNRNGGHDPRTRGRSPGRAMDTQRLPKSDAQKPDGSSREPSADAPAGGGRNWPSTMQRLMDAKTRADNDGARQASPGGVRWKRDSNISEQNAAGEDKYVI